MPVDSEVDEVLALAILELSVDEAELHGGLFDAFGEVTLVECEPKLAVFQDVVGARLIIAASRAFHRPGSKDVASVGSIPAPPPRVQRGLHLGGEYNSFCRLGGHA